MQELEGTMQELITKARRGYTFHPRPTQPSCNRDEARRERAWR